MNILQNIFKDNCEIIEYSLHPRNAVMENITKMINCDNPSLGGAMCTCDFWRVVKHFNYTYFRKAFQTALL